MFRRRRSRADDETDVEVESPDNGSEAETAADPVNPRSDGPWDFSEVDPADLTTHVDLGGVLLPGRPDMELRIDWDEATGTVNTVTVVIGASALQVQPFAAPRREGIWDDVRAEIAAGITQQGGVATEKDGALGVELHARVPTTEPNGSAGVQLARFVGVDGPRWFLRGVLTGEAYADPVGAAPLEELFRAIVVVRGSDPMAPREPIGLRLPAEVAAGAGAAGAGAAEGESEESDGAQADGAQRPPLEPFERGPEITEIH